MVSRDFKTLMELIHSQKYKIQSISMDINNSKKTKNVNPFTTFIYLKRLEEGCTFSSDEEDVFSLASLYSQIIDDDGNWEFMKFRNFNQYYSDVLALIDLDDSKRQASLHRIKPDDYKPLELEGEIKSYLLDKDRTAIKYNLLKVNYFDICAYYTLYSNEYVKIDKKLRKGRPKYNQYLDIINRILGLAFRSGKNPIINFKNYKSFIGFEINDAEKACSVQKRYHNMQYENYAASKKLSQFSFDDITRVPLEILRRYNESVIKYFNAIRIGIELLDGVQKPRLNKSFIENVNIIKSYKEYSPLAEFVNPIIRNAVSHNSDEIDQSNMKILFYDKRNEKKVLVGECPINDLQRMITGMDKYLIPSLICSFKLNEMVLLLMALHSPEYRISLLGIGNKG